MRWKSYGTQIGRNLIPESMTTLNNRSCWTSVSLYRCLSLFVITVCVFVVWYVQSCGKEFLLGDNKVKRFKILTDKILHLWNFITVANIINRQNIGFMFQSNLYHVLDCPDDVALRCVATKIEPSSILFAKQLYCFDWPPCIGTPTVSPHWLHSNELEGSSCRARVGLNSA